MKKNTAMDKSHHPTMFFWESIGNKKIVTHLGAKQSALLRSCKTIFLCHLW